MIPTQRLIALAFLAAACGLAAPLPVRHADAREPGPRMQLIARGGGERGADSGKKKKTAEQRLLETVGGEFKARSHTALAARMPGGKAKSVTLQLGHYTGKYSQANAKGALEDWFEDREIVSVKMTSNTGLIGHFDIRLRKFGTDTLKNRKLKLGLRKVTKADGTQKTVLVKIEVRGS